MPGRGSAGSRARVGGQELEQCQYDAAGAVEVPRLHVFKTVVRGVVVGILRSVDEHAGMPASVKLAWSLADARPPPLMRLADSPTEAAAVIACPTRSGCRPVAVVSPRQSCRG